MSKYLDQCWLNKHISMSQKNLPFLFHMNGTVDQNTTFYLTTCTYSLKFLNKKRPV